MPVEQINLVSPLDGLNILADRRLRQMQPFGGFAKIPLFGGN